MSQKKADIIEEYIAALKRVEQASDTSYDPSTVAQLVIVGHVSSALRYVAEAMSSTVGRDGTR